ncbi:MAG: hypothetical protein P8175_13920 [Deltaproteobacteria bacterium]
MTRSAKCGVVFLLFAFVSVPLLSTNSFAEDRLVSSSGGFGAANSSGAETSLAASPVAPPPSAMAPNTVLALMLGVIALSALLAAAAAS